MTIPEKEILCWNCHEPVKEPAISPVTKNNYCEHCLADVTPDKRCAA